MLRSIRNHVAALVAAMLLLVPLALAQVTTGTVTGRVVDASGGVVPGVNVTLTSEVHGNKIAPVKTNKEGDYTFPDITADTYTVEASAPAFKTTRVTGIFVTGGAHVGVPPITLEVGGTAETVTVQAEATAVQTQSGERSAAIEQVAIESMPIAHSNFAGAILFAPGVQLNSAGYYSRLGDTNGDESNIMMNGVSAMDTGNNGQMLSLNIESIGEVKVLTQGYQAEYGRASGLQITSVTKSGTNEIHGAAYGIWTSSNWNSRTWANQKNGTPQAYSYSDTYGFTVGGPIWIPHVFNGKNKLFFFVADEFRPSNTVVNVGNFLRLPTALERAGNYSQSLNNNGVAIPNVIDNTTGAPFPGNIIPSNRLYAPGVAVLNQYPLPNLTQQPGSPYNYAEQAGSYSQLLTQPVFHLDYNATSKLRFNSVFNEQTQRPVVIPGTIPGFNDAYSPIPIIYNFTATVDWIITPTLVLEGTYGTIKNQLAGGGSPGALLADAAANRNNTLSAFPNLYPNAGKLSTGYYAYQTLQTQGTKAPEYSNGTLNMPPAWGWGSLIGDAPPSLIFPSYFNVNHTQDVAISLTKVWGQHTIKGGFYFNHSWKAQNTGAGGVPNLYWQGYVDFENNTNNPLDSGFGFANAVLGTFYQDQQQSTYVEGSFLYNNVEGYLQDNWKVTKHLTLDYGMRFTHMTPQYDQFDQESNFFPGQFSAANSQVLYTAGCSNGATVCSGNTRDAKNPLTGQVLTAGGANTQVLIGTPIPGVGNPLNGIMQAGHGIANTNYVWSPFVVAPRAGFAWDVTGKSDWVIRGGAGLFYDRPDGNTVFSTPGNVGVTAANGTPVTDQSLYYGQLQTIGTGGLSPLPVGQMVVTQYNAQIPSTAEWNFGVQKTLPGGMVLDASYVGYYAYNRFGATQGGSQQLENQVPLGTAYLPQYQDPTLGTSSVPGATAFTTNLLRPYPGLQSIAENATKFHDVYHSIQLSVTRRLKNNVSFGLNYTRGIELEGNTGLIQRYALSNGALVLRPDEAQYEALNSTLDATPNFLKGNITWFVPGIEGRGGFLHQLTKDWQISSVLTVQSGAAYTPSYTYQTNGSNVNITGSPDFAGAPVIAQGLGSGCGNRLDAFNESDVTGPAYGSVQLESGRNYLRYCPQAIPDVSVVRRFHFWKFKESKTFEFRTDIFNAVNAEYVTTVQTQAQFNNPASMTLVNSEYNNGVVNTGRSTPANAGFGAATAATASRNIQLEVRIGW